MLASKSARPRCPQACQLQSLTRQQTHNPAACQAQKALDEAGTPAGPQFLGLPLGQALILLAPVLLYAAFTVYRTSFNRSAKLSDFFFALATIAVFGNILSIVFFKLRFF